MSEAQWIRKPPPTIEEEVDWAARSVYTLRAIDIERMKMHFQGRVSPYNDEITASDVWHFLNSVETSLKLASKILGVKFQTEEVPLPRHARSDRDTH